MDFAPQPLVGLLKERNIVLLTAVDYCMDRNHGLIAKPIMKELRCQPTPFAAGQSSLSHWSFLPDFRFLLRRGGCAIMCLPVFILLDAARWTELQYKMSGKRRNAILKQHFLNFLFAFYLAVTKNMSNHRQQPLPLPWAHSSTDRCMRRQFSIR